MKVIVFTLFIFVLHSNTFAQPDKEVAAAVEKLRLAMIDPTKDGLMQLTSSNLSYGHSNGMIETQNLFIEALMSGKSDFKTITLSDQTIALTGKNIAVVRHKLFGETLNSGTPGTANLGVLMVWIKEKGTWKLLARQAFKL